MHIKIIVPINDSTYNKTVLAAARSVASPGTMLTIENISQGNNCIESPEDSKMNAPYTAGLIKQTEEDGYDGVFVCDMDMCGIQLAKDTHGVKIPVHGGFSSNMPVAADRGNFIVMTILDSVIAMQQQFTETYGQNHCVAISAIGLGVHELHDNKKSFDILYNKTCEVLKEYEAYNIKSVVFGCSGFVNMAQRLTKALTKVGYHDILAIDPNRTAITVLEKEIIRKNA